MTLKYRFATLYKRTFKLLAPRRLVLPWLEVSGIPDSTFFQSIL
jgi:hypothetical protein